jgi:hypothetical protein
VSVYVARNSPELLVEIDFTNPPTNATRVWTDVSAYVRQINYTSDGRDNELTRTSPGTLSALFDNRDGRFDSTNTASPYYPKVKRKRFLRVSAVWSGTRYSRWTGLIDTWRQQWPSAGRDATADITATSTFATLNLLPLDGESVGSDLTGHRVITVLTGATLPAAGPFPTGTNTLQHLLDVEATENGRVFTDPDGLIAFQDRHHRLLDATSTTAQATIGDQFGEIPYQTGELDLDESDLFNVAAVTPVGGTPQVWSDADSIEEHYERRIDVNSLSNSASEALASAQYLVGRYKDTGPRITTLPLLVSTAPAFWPTVLATTISYRYTWKRRASAHTISQDVFVERVSESVAPGNGWLVSFQLSPAVDQAAWVAGVVGFSEAGVTTRATY